MKHALIAGLIGIAITIALDSVARVLISIYIPFDILMIAYAAYPGIIWPVVLVLIAGLTSFFGALFSLTYGKQKKKMSAAVFGLLLLVVRYGQLHLLIDRETLLYPILALILSFLALFLVWKMLSGKTETKTKHHFPDGDGSDAGEAPES